MLQPAGVDTLLASMGFETGQNLAGLGPVLAVKDVQGGDLLDYDAGVAVVMKESLSGCVPAVAWLIDDHWVCSRPSSVATPDDFRRAIFARVACYFAALAADWSARIKRADLERRDLGNKSRRQTAIATTDTAA